MRIYDLIYIALLAIFVGCAGIRGSGGTPDEEPTTTKTNKVFKGKVSQVNLESDEITINGVLISVQGAEVYRNEVPVNIENIRAGQIVSVETATYSSKKGKYGALKIEIEDQLVGPVESIDTTTNSITILGQIVHITSATSFTQKSFKTLKVNYYLAVFAFRNNKGILEATLIELVSEYFQPSIDKVKIAGEVVGVDVESGNIILEGVEIKIASEEIKDIKVGDALSFNGLGISVDAPSVLTANATETIIQSEVKSYDLNREVVLEGLPQKITSRNQFTLNGYLVTVPIEIMDNNNIQSVENRKLIVSGVFVAEKEVLADSLRVEQIKDFEFRGVLKPTGQENIISIFDRQIEINVFTFIDFNLKEVLLDIQENLTTVTVYSKGYFNSEGKRIATTLSLNKDDKEQFEFIKGKIEIIDGEVLMVSGITIKLNNFVIFKNEDRALNNLDLLTMLAVDDRVEVFGGFNQEKVFIVYFLAKKPAALSEGEKADTEK